MKSVEILFCFFTVLISCDGQSPISARTDFCNFQSHHVCCNPDKKRPENVTKLRFVNDDLTKFREEALYLHNYYRNSSATHRDDNISETRTGSNINAISYDFDLEYTAWCNVMGGYLQSDGIDSFPNLFNYIQQNVGQFINTTEKKLLANNALEKITEWWMQNEFIGENTLDHYYKLDVEEDVTKYALLVWWSVTHVGCARATWGYTNAKQYVYYIVCNYGTKTENSLRRKFAPVYARGPPCSKCENVYGPKSCNKKFTGLCGDIEPIPTGWEPDATFTAYNKESSNTKDSKARNISVQIKAISPLNIILLLIFVKLCLNYCMIN